MLIDQIKKRMFQAMKDGNAVEKEILRTAIGEVTSTGEEATDERVTQVMRKLVKSNRETLASSADAEQKRTLEEEIEILEGFLPRPLGAEQLAAVLAPVADAIRAAAGPGPAMGIAMKHLKAEGQVVEARQVQQAIASLRGA